MNKPRDVIANEVRRAKDEARRRLCANSWTDVARAASLVVRRAAAAAKALGKPYVDFPGAVWDGLKGIPKETADWLTQPDTSLATTGNPTWVGGQSTLPVSSGPGKPGGPNGAEPPLTKAEAALEKAKQDVAEEKMNKWLMDHPGKKDLDYAQALVDAANLKEFGTTNPTSEQFQKAGKGAVSAKAAAVVKMKKAAWMKANPGGTDAEWEKVDAANLAAWKKEHPMTKDGAAGDAKAVWLKAHPGADGVDYLTAKGLADRIAADPAGYAKEQWKVRNPQKTDADYNLVLERKKKAIAKKKAGGS